MARTARKSIANEDLKRRLPLKQNLKLAEQAETNLHAIERAGMAGFSAAAANFTAMAEMWKNAYAKGLGACTGGSEKSVTDVANIGQCLMEGWQKMDDEIMKMCREAVECRSIDEFYNLQRRTAALMMGDWFRAVQRTAGNATAHFVPMMGMFAPD